MKTSFDSFVKSLETTWQDKILPQIRDSSEQLIDLALIKGKTALILGKWKLHKLAHSKSNSITKKDILSDLTKTNIPWLEYTSYDRAYILLAITTHLEVGERLIIISESGSVIKVGGEVILEKRTVLELSENILNNTVRSIELLFIDAE